MGISFVLVGILFIPNVRKAEKKKFKVERKEPDDNKDWKALCLQLEKYIHNLRKEILVLEKRTKDLEKDLGVERQKYDKIQEKLAQERGWQQKESVDSDKKAKEIMQLKRDLVSVEENLAREHGQRLQLEKSTKGMIDDIDRLNNEKISFELEISRLKAHVDVQRKEIIELRDLNAKLSKKQEDATWVAKSEYLRVERELKLAQEELDKLRNKGA